MEKALLTHTHIHTNVHGWNICIKGEGALGNIFFLKGSGITLTTHITFHNCLPTQRPPQHFRFSNCMIFSILSSYCIILISFMIN